MADSESEARTEHKVPRSMCYDAINRWRRWATIWAAISVLQWLAIIGLVGGFI